MIRMLLGRWGAGEGGSATAFGGRGQVGVGACLQAEGAGLSHRSKLSKEMKPSVQCACGCRTMSDFFAVPCLPTGDDMFGCLLLIFPAG